MTRYCRTIVFWAALFCAHIAHAQTALIVWSSTNAGGVIQPYLDGRLAAMGYTVTSVDTNTSPLPSLTGYSQIWDIRYDITIAPAENTSYQGYLGSGGSLFLLGEDPSGYAARDASIASVIQTAGGGAVTIGSTSDDAQTVGPPFNGPIPITSVTYMAVGSFSALGTGAAVTQDTSSRPGAAYWAPGTLSNAMTGRIISVLDVNIIIPFSAQSSYVDNLAAYLSPPPLPAPTSVTATAGIEEISVAFTGPAGATGHTVTCSSGTAGAASPISAGGSASPITVTGATAGASYTCTVTATDGTRTSAASAPSTAVTPAAPVPPIGAPTNVGIAPGNAQLQVSFTLSAGATSYTTTCTSADPGAASPLTSTGAVSPIVVPGATNGASYHCTVTATDGSTVSAPSSASAAATPTAGPAPTVATIPTLSQWGLIILSAALGWAALLMARRRSS